MEQDPQKLNDEKLIDPATNKEIPPPPDELEPLKGWRETVKKILYGE